ncbi:MAG: hypothetical protein K0M58_06665 [Thiobacillus sp.]|nr:hypothetical protein [Thiobacillus sp.]
MIAMGITSIYDECRRDAVASAPGYPAPGTRFNALDVGGGAAVDDEARVLAKVKP